MKKGQKFLLCSVLIICAAVLLLIGYMKKVQSVIVVDKNHQEYYEGYIYIDDVPYEFHEKWEDLAIAVTLTNEDKEVAVRLPICREDEAWVVDDNDFVKEEKHIVSNEEEYQEFILDIREYDLEEISFKKVKQDDISENNHLPYSFMFNINFEYEGTKLKNLFYDEIVKINQPVYVYNKGKQEAYFEIPLTVDEKNFDKIKNQKEYMQEYWFDLTLYYDKDAHNYEHSQRMISIEDLFDSKSYQYGLIELIDQDKIEAVNESYKKNKLRIEISMIPTTNELESYDTTFDIRP